jgi:predicted metal-dependent hydrolase
MWHLLKLHRRTKRPSQLYVTHKAVARSRIHERLSHYATHYGFVYQRVAIRDTRRSWGSCSSRGNLNFSYKLLFLPPCLFDYIVVHELCHLRVLNHSQAFWDEVIAIMPDARERADTLRRFERTYGTSVDALMRWQRQHTCSACTQIEDCSVEILAPTHRSNDSTNSHK